MPLVKATPNSQQDWLALLSEAWQRRETDRENCLSAAQAAEHWRENQPHTDTSELRYAALVLRAFVAWRQGKTVEALTSLEEVFSHAPQGSLWFVRALNVQVGLSLEAGDMGRSLTLLEEQLESSRALGDTLLEASALHDLGAMRNAHGLPEGEIFLRSALQLFEAAQHEVGQAFAHLNLGHTYILKEDPEKAQHHLRLAEKLADQHGLPYVLTMALAFQGSLVQEKDPARAEALFWQALERQRQFEDRPMWEAAEPLTRLLMQQGRYQEAEQLALDFLAEAEQCKMHTIRVPTLALISEIQEALGNLGGALYYLKAHLTEFKQLRQLEYEQRNNALDVLHRTQMLRSQSEMQRQRAEELMRLSQTDELTGLPNRRHLMQYGQELFSQAKGTVGLIDIDYFKRINDELGHDIGDKVLREFAKRLRGSVRQEDWVARFGGEEFVLLFPNLDTLKAAQIVRRFQLELLNQPLMLESSAQIPVTFTAGITACGDGDLMDAFRRADTLLYEGKHLGRDRVLVDKPPA